VSVKPAPTPGLPAPDWASSGDSTDVDHLAELAEAGFQLGMDRFGLDTTLSTSDRVATVVALVERGYADRLVLSHDASCYFDWADPTLLPLVLPNWHYRRIHESVLPSLRERG
jgi:phosphotriesterase-related protein